MASPPEAATPATEQAPPASTWKKRVGLGLGLGLLILGLIYGLYYSEQKEAATAPKDASEVGVFSVDGLVRTPASDNGPLIVPAALDKGDTSQIGSGAAVDQAAQAVQSSPSANAAVGAIDDAAQDVASQLTFNAGSILSPASKLIASAGLPDVASMAQTQGNPKLQEFVDKMAERTAQSTQLEAALAQFQKAVFRKEACTPQDGPGLVEAIGARCLYIKLAPGVQYNLTKVAINVTYPVAIVGDPFHRPLLDGRKTPRLFNVLPGGFLDLQYVRVYRGTVRSYLDGNYAVCIGGGALLFPGAGANFLGVVFLNPTETWLARDIKGLFIIGGNVLNMGGLVTFTDCHFFTVGPVNARIVTVIGGQLLTVAGVSIESGCTHTQVAGVAVGVGVFGLLTAVLGGVSIVSGVVFNRNLGAQFGSGAGIQTAVGGGVAIYSGVVFNTQGGLFAMFGSAVKQFLGAGVLINSGVTQNKQFGVNIFCGLGPFMSVGAGTNHNSGSVFNINSGAAFLASSGAQHFLGAGHASYVGCAFSRTFGQVAAYGLGGTICADVGDLEIIASPTAVIAGLSASAMLSLQYFMAAGYMVIIRSPSIRLAALYWRAGQGIAAYVGAGNLTVIRTRDTFRGFLGSGQTLSGRRQVKYFCHGRPYTEVNKVKPILKPANPKFAAYTPSPKPFLPTKARHRALAGQQRAAQATANATAVMNVFKAALEAYEGPTAACFDRVTVTDTTGGSLPAAGALIKGLLEGNAKDVFAGGAADCESPFLGSEYKLDACTVKDSTLTGCANPGYLGLATQDAEVCSPQGTCRLPLGLASDAAAAALAVPEAEDAVDRRRRHQRLLQPQQEPLAEAAAGVGVIQVLRGDVMVTCRERGVCKDATALKAAMAEYLGLGAGAKVSVSVDQLDPLVARHLGIEPEADDAAGDDAGSGDGGCDAVVQYNLYVVTKDPQLAAQFKAAMLEFNKAPTNDAFTAHLRASPAFATLCTIAGLVSFNYAVPLANAAANLVGDTTGSAITPAVAVVDESGLGIDAMQPGQWVVLKLTKFPTDSLATITLANATGAVVATVASFTPQSSDGGFEVVSWQVPADLAPGFYIFSGSSASNLVIKAMSSIIKVTPAESGGSGAAAGLFGRRRRTG